MKERIKKIISTVFDIDATAFEDQALNADTIERWDSLSHLTLIICLEEEFEIEIDPVEIPRLKSFAEIIAILEKHGVS